MRKFIDQLLSVLIIILILASPLHSKSQKCLPGIDKVEKPVMSLKDGDARVADFNSRKKSEIIKKSGYIQQGTVKLPNFLGMLAYFNSLNKYDQLEVIIGMYGKKGAPRGYKQQLTLIFAPADNNGVELDKNVFYIIPPDYPFDPDKLDDFQITVAEKDQLVANYESAMPTSIDITNPANICRTCTSNIPTDTKSIYYLKDGLNELIREQKYCHYIDGNVEVPLSNDFLAFFTSQNLKKPGEKDNYRLSIALGFTDDNFNFIDITKTTGFDGRPESVLKSKMNYTDNGQLCPTYCPNR